MAAILGGITISMFTIIAMYFMYVRAAASFEESKLDQLAQVFNEARSDQKKDQYTRAEQGYQNVIKALKHPKTMPGQALKADAIANLGHVYIQWQKLDLAYAILINAVDQGIEDRNVYNNLAFVVQVLHKDLDSAQAWLDKANDLKSKDGRLHKKEAAASAAFRKRQGFVI
ncbi:hypothetical protein CYMTET_17465 [Cymbomonas tetramitiformis]|uniref:Uncharacterized protein n=1 Tax=Cymbomonas tetramitiformis TaxID=36881 RepID=A0AAE0GA20_9CHLO|nr:hypothetical protein CYMTET_17465 [Cymbomonas tetramitiformis]